MSGGVNGVAAGGTEHPIRLAHLYPPRTTALLWSVTATAPPISGGKTVAPSDDKLDDTLLFDTDKCSGSTALKRGHVAAATAAATELATKTLER